MVADSAGFNTGVMMDSKRLPSIGESYGNLPDVSELDASVFLEDMEANSMNVLDMGLEEFKGGRVYSGVGTSNPGGNLNDENLKNNMNRSAGPSNLMLNVVPNLGYGLTFNSPYVSWLEDHYHLLVTNNTELYNRVEKLLFEKAEVKCQVNEFKGKLLTCELDVVGLKKEVERLVRKKKEVRDRLVYLDQEVIYVRKACDR
nr:hypothetical protein [Tanacetum cinerariifolium]